MSIDRFCISAGVLGSDHHMTIDSDGISLSFMPPHDCWLLSGHFRNDDHLCLDTLLKLHGVWFNSQPDQRWKNMMASVGCVEDVPWSKVLPPSQYKLHVKNLIKSVIAKSKDISQEYYRNTWHPCGAIFRRLRPAKIDTSTYKSIIDAEGHGNGALETFKPSSGGYASQVVYDRFGTRTGRLTVESGPQILTLKKEHKKIIKSYYQDGRIVSLDFAALEARVLLFEAGHQPTSSDIYTQISKDLFEGRVERSIIKVAVLSELYGASRASLDHRLNMPSADLDVFIKSIKSYFKTAILKARLKEEFEKKGNITNKFGRPLFIDSKNSDYLLVNTYAQSTGADISLLGFSKITEALGSDGIRPLFVLHDALILDVRPDRLRDVESITSINISGYDHGFSIKPEVIG